MGHERDLSGGGDAADPGIQSPNDYNELNSGNPGGNTTSSNVAKAQAVAKEITRNRLSDEELRRLQGWLVHNEGWAQSLQVRIDDIAAKATAELGFMVTGNNINAAAELVGVSTKWTVKRTREQLKIDYYEHPPVPRLCVAPAVPNCFGSRLFDLGKNVYLYRTVSRRRANRPRKVWDAVITGERWLLPGTVMEAQGFIKGETVDKMTELPWLYHEETKNKCSIRLRIACQKLAWQVLGSKYPNRWWRDYTHRLAHSFGVGDPEKYIWEAMECMA